MEKNIVVNVFVVDNYVSSLAINPTNLQEKDYSVKIIGKNHYCHPIFIEGLNYIKALKIAQDYLDKYQIEYNKEIFGGLNENTN